MDLLIIVIVVGILGYGAFHAPGRAAWVAGAALFLFCWAIVFAIVGRNDLVSVLFLASAVALVAHQYLRRRVTFPHAD